MATAQAILERAPAGSSIDSTLGELSLTELAALLSYAELFVGPDAGPMHVAAAAGAAVLELGWVPADYPITSRGERTAGRCWSPWTPRAITVRPQAAEFARRSRASDFWQQPIAGLPLDEIEIALDRVLGRH
jgi:hypothetical protein